MATIVGCHGWQQQLVSQTARNNWQPQLANAGKRTVGGDWKQFAPKLTTKTLTAETNGFDKRPRRLATTATTGNDNWQTYAAETVDSATWFDQQQLDFATCVAMKIGNACYRLLQPFAFASWCCTKCSQLFRPIRVADCCCHLLFTVAAPQRRCQLLLPLVAAAFVHGLAVVAMRCFNLLQPLVVASCRC